MKSTLIWDRLNLEGREIAISEELRRSAHALGKDPDNVIDHLVRYRYIEPLFRGIYYVRNPTERRFGSERYSHLDLMSLALARKGVDRWYFGLETALKLNALTHEYFPTETVITDRLYRPKGISLSGRRFVILKWKPGLLSFGITTKGPVRFSDAEKTVLDLAYRARWRGAPDTEIMAIVDEYKSDLDTKRLNAYLRRYPHSLREVLKRSR